MTLAFFAGLWEELQSKGWLQGLGRARASERIPAGTSGEVT